MKTTRRRIQMKRMSSIVILWGILAGMATAGTPSPAATDSSKDMKEASEEKKGWLDQDHLFGFGDWDKQRSTWEDNGVLFVPTYSAEVFGNPIGGAKQGAVYAGLLDLELTLDLKKMADWDGCFHVSANYTMGDDLSAADTHDLLGVSGLTSYNTLLLFELWYEQRFLDDKLSLRVGQMGADSEFCISKNAATFLGSTYGWPAIINNNVPNPNAPYGSPGIRLRIDPDERWDFMAAVYAGNPGPDRLGNPDPGTTPGRNFDNSGTAFNISEDQGFFVISEVAYNLNQEKDARDLPGTYKLGGWIHTGKFANMRDDDHGISLADPASDGRPKTMHGNEGLYVVADQAIWQDRSNPDRIKEIGLFLRGGNARNDRSTFDYYVDGGVVFHGLVPGRPDDFFGVSTAYGHMSSALSDEVEDDNNFNGANEPIPDGENNIELTYYAQIAPWWTVQPDLQIIVHPGGSSAIPDALVLGCRTVITF